MHKWLTALLPTPAPPLPPHEQAFQLEAQELQLQAWGTTAAEMYSCGAAPWLCCMPAWCGRNTSAPMLNLLPPYSCLRCIVARALQPAGSTPTPALQTVMHSHWLHINPSQAWT